MSAGPLSIDFTHWLITVSYHSALCTAACHLSKFCLLYSGAEFIVTFPLMTCPQVFPFPQPSVKDRSGNVNKTMESYTFQQRAMAIDGIHLCPQCGGSTQELSLREYVHFRVTWCPVRRLTGAMGILPADSDITKIDRSRMSPGPVYIMYRFYSNAITCCSSSVVRAALCLRYQRDRPAVSCG